MNQEYFQSYGIRAFVARPILQENKLDATAAE